LPLAETELTDLWPPIEFQWKLSLPYYVKLIKDPAGSKGIFRRWLTLNGYLRPLLLYHMNQLMGNQPSSLLRLRCELTRRKHHVVSNRVSLGVHVARRLLGNRVGMQPHSRKVLSKARLHERARCRIQRLAL
jgi:hypothetical protein